MVNITQGYIVFSPVFGYILCMTIIQTIDIPASRQITVPREVPLGPATITYASPVEVKKRATPLTDSLSGILSGMGDVSLDEIKMERLAKHLK